MATAPTNPPAEPKNPTPEGMRELDAAVGGGTVPIGPLGGPAPKTNAELNAERIAAEDKAKEQERAEAEAVVVAKKGDATVVAATADNPLN
jgi:hypothetical protein